MGLLVIGDQRVARSDVDQYQYVEEKVLIAVENYVDPFWGLRVSQGFSEAEEMVWVLRLQIHEEEWCFHNSPRLLASARIFRGMKGQEAEALRHGILGAYRDWQTRENWRYVFDLDHVLKDLER